MVLLYIQNNKLSEVCVFLLFLPLLAVCSVIMLIIYSKYVFRSGTSLKIVNSSLKKNTYVNKRRMLKPTHSTLHATYNSLSSIYITILLAAIMGWLSWQIACIYHQDYPVLKPFSIMFGAYTLLLCTLAVVSKPFVLKKNQIRSAAAKAVAILVPVYNEDPEALRSCLKSMLTQVHMPHEIHVVDDGSNINYDSVRRWLYTQSRSCGVHVTWYRQVNAGKRAAQINAYHRVSQNCIDYIATVDSDCELDPHAIEEAIKPFLLDKKIASVAGVVIAKNAQYNVLARITDLIFVSGQQLIDRAGMSQLRSVIVNSGGLALYKTRVIQNAITNDYDNETFMGRQVKFSDDSYLTLIALKMGKTVQQQSAIVFSDMPVTFSHHARQQVRWGRGSFIRGMWRMRYLSFFSWGALRQCSGWIMFACMFSVQIDVFIISPLVYGKPFPVEFLIIPILFVYFTALRYFTIKRSNMSRSSQLYTYSLSIIAIFWTTIILRAIRLYAISTCARTGWGTRSDVEIIYEIPDAAVA